MTTISAMTVAAAITVSAQTPTPAPQPRPATEQAQPQTERQRPAGELQSRPSDQTVTVTGCLMAEKDVPERRESMAERAGMGEDYILTNVKMAAGATTSAIGLATMYQVKGGSVKESELKNHLGHQIEITGRLDSDNSNMSSTRGAAGATGTTASARTPATSVSDRTAGAVGVNSRANLQNLEASSVKMIAATCAAR